MSLSAVSNYYRPLYTENITSPFAFELKSFIRPKARYPWLKKAKKRMQKPLHLLFLLSMSPGLLLASLVLLATGSLKQNWSINSSRNSSRNPARSKAMVSNG